MTDKKRIVKLIMVTDPNGKIATAKSGNNKYYNLEDNGDGTFTVKYGRVGGHEATRTYPMSKWDSTIRSKLRKGYRDVTPQKTEKNISFVGVHSEVLELLNLLQRYAGQHINKTYIGTAADITFDQVQQALNYLTTASNIYETDPEKANENLISVYSLIPRKMENVGFYLIKGNPERDLNLIQSEMDNLQTLAQQVQMQSGDQEEINPLESMGLEIEPISKLPVSDHPRFRVAFRVKNKATQGAFDNISIGGLHENLWHGTKREVGLSIMQGGLNVSFGSYGLFGKGLYHADNWRKAQQYSRGFYFLQNVQMGKKVYKPSGHAGRLDYNKITQMGYDSCFGHTNYNEYIVYQNCQTTVSHFLIVD